MIIAKLSDQLGNQMFAYAAVKTIALDKGVDFAFFVHKNKGDIINDTDPRYGNQVDSIFSNVRSEIVKEIPDNYNHFQEITSAKSASAFQKESLEVADNTVMSGHYISPTYFMHRIKSVREWFTFPNSITENIDLSLAKIRIKYFDRELVSVHFRNAKDYRDGGYMLQKEFWTRAALKINSLYANPLFIVFYDQKTDLVKDFIQKFDAIEMRGTLVEDMYAISLCDVHVVCNSSFSIMAALLDSKVTSKVFRPSTCPIPGGYKPSDVYCDEWEIIEGKKDWWSEVRRIKKVKKYFKI
jgi:hypothetical protein